MNEFEKMCENLLEEGFWDRARTSFNAWKDERKQTRQERDTKLLPNKVNKFNQSYLSTFQKKIARYLRKFETDYDNIYFKDVINPITSIVTEITKDLEILYKKNKVEDEQLANAPKNFKDNVVSVLQTYHNDLKLLHEKLLHDLDHVEFTAKGSPTKASPVTDEEKAFANAKEEAPKEEPPKEATSKEATPKFIRKTKDKTSFNKARQFYSEAEKSGSVNLTLPLNNGKEKTFTIKKEQIDVPNGVIIMGKDKRKISALKFIMITPKNTETSQGTPEPDSFTD